MILRHTVLAILLLQISSASTYTLNEILTSVAKDDTLTRSLQQERLALAAKNRADTASEPIELFTEGTRAHPIAAQSGHEYAVGMTKRFMLGSIQEQERRMTHLSNQAYLLEEEINILNFKNSIKNIYHQHCLDSKSYRSFYKSYKAFEKLYKKKQKAYKYQEISKVELMQLEIEKNSLFAQLQEMKSQQETSKKNLFMLTNITPGKNAKLSCKDMYPIRSYVQINNAFELSKEAYNKRIESTKEALDRYSSRVDSIDVSAQYAKELDMDKYTVGVSIPLNFTSSKNEEARVAAMYENSSLSLKHEQTMREKKSLLSQLQAHLKSSAMTLKSLKNNYRNYQKNLLPLMKKSYDLGETSVIEYLLNRQRSHQLKQEIFSTQRAYYTLLFQLYTLSEKKDRK